MFRKSPVVVRSTSVDGQLSEQSDALDRTPSPIMSGGTPSTLSLSHELGSTDNSSSDLRELSPRTSPRSRGTSPTGPSPTWQILKRNGGQSAHDLFANGDKPKPVTLGRKNSSRSLGIRGGSRYAELFHAEEKRDHVATFFTTKQQNGDKEAAQKAMWVYYEHAINKYYEKHIWSSRGSFPSDRYPLLPAQSVESNPSSVKRTVTVLVDIDPGQQAGKVHVDCRGDSTVRFVLRKVCASLDVPDDYNYELHMNDKPLTEGTSVDSLFERARSPSLSLHYHDIFGNQGAPKRRLNHKMTFKKHDRKRISITGGFFGKPEIKKKLGKDTLYLSALLFNDAGEMLMTADGLLPSVEITKSTDFAGPHSDDFMWILKKSLDLELEARNKSPKSTANLLSSSAGQGDIKSAFMEAVERLRSILGEELFGVMHDEPITTTVDDNCVILIMRNVTHDKAFQSDSFLGGNLSWGTLTHLSALYPKSLQLWSNMTSIYGSRLEPLQRGLYLGLFYARNSVSTLDVLVNGANRQMLPLTRIRDDANLTEEETRWLQTAAFFNKPTVMSTRLYVKEEKRNIIIEQRNRRVAEPDAEEDPLLTFKSSVFSNLEKLMNDVHMEWAGTDLYKPLTIDIGQDGQAKVLLFVKPMTELGDHQERTVGSACYVPLPVFETLHQHVHNPRLASDIRTRMADLEEKIILLDELARCADEVDERKTRLGKLQDIQERFAEERERWKSLSWTLKVLEWDRQRSWDRMTSGKGGYVGSQSPTARVAVTA